MALTSAACGTTAVASVKSTMDYIGFSRDIRWHYISSHGEVLWNPGNRLYRICRVKRGDCLKGMSLKPDHAVTYRAGDDKVKNVRGKDKGVESMQKELKL